MRNRNRRDGSKDTKFVFFDRCDRFPDRPAIEVQNEALTYRQLPGCMVLRGIRFLSEFPLNANGKVDRNQLLEILQHTNATSA